MTIYNDVFGGANIYPSEISYSAQVLTADVTLAWPEETSSASNFATRIIDISSLDTGRSITMPPASGTGVGETVLFNNVGSTDIVIKNNAGTQIISSQAGTVWQAYLTDNSTAAGVWVALQYGASATSANASALAGTGLIAIGTLLAQALPVTTFNSDYTAGDSDRAKMMVWSGAVGTLDLPAPGSVGNNWFMFFKNSGTGAVSVDPAGSATIDGSATLSYQPNESSIIATDGNNYYTIGFGQPATFAFDYTSVDLTGETSYTLTSSELNRIAYSFTGTLSADCEVIVPATVQQYWVTDNCTGSFTLTVKTLAGTGINFADGESGIVYCNGVDVVVADTAGISLPITVSQGGTGSITAPGALINLGGTSTGIAIFTSASANAVWSTLGNPPLISGGAF